MRNLFYALPLMLISSPALAQACQGYADWQYGDPPVSQMKDLQHWAALAFTPWGIAHYAILLLIIWQHKRLWVAIPGLLVSLVGPLSVYWLWTGPFGSGAFREGCEAWPIFETGLVILPYGFALALLIIPRLRAYLKDRENYKNYWCHDED